MTQSRLLPEKNELLLKGIGEEQEIFGTTKNKKAVEAEKERIRKRS